MYNTFNMIEILHDTNFINFSEKLSTQEIHKHSSIKCK